MTTYRLVPVEPSEDWLNAVCEQRRNAVGPNAKPASWWREDLIAFHKAIIASAPVPQNELLEAARKARVIVEKWCHYQGNTPELFAEYLAPLDAAIRNAEQAQGTQTP
jgi:hypothetical protein